MSRLRARLNGLSILSQTLLLLIGALALAQLAAVALIFALPPPRPDFNRLSDIADALAGAPVERNAERGQRERPLTISVQSAPPLPDKGMRDDPRFTMRLADRLGVPDSAVRLYFQPDQRGAGRFPGARRERRVMMRRGEPIFFNTVVAAYDTGNGWRTVTTPPAPWIAPWQQRLILYFLLTALLMLPFAWLFARRLTLPIRRFADAADRIGADPNAPPVPQDGPAELRIAAQALNGMQQRLAEYVRDRTAMIGAIAHDLRTPLARIAFRIEAAPDDVRGKVQADIEQMRAMIAATIGFVHNTTRAQKRVPVDLAALLDRLAAQDRETGRAVDCAAESGATVLGDPNALIRLFQNLIDNAVGYGEAARLRLSSEGNRAVVSVADDGPGLPAALMERVFNPFERGEPSRNRQTGGIGLGLTIARTIAEDHGGTLTLANGSERGLVARVELPLA